MTSYAKRMSAKANVGEAHQLAMQASYPATVAARFALILSLLAVVLSAVAIALAVRR